MRVGKTKVDKMASPDLNREMGGWSSTIKIDGVEQRVLFKKREKPYHGRYPWICEFDGTTIAVGTTLTHVVWAATDQCSSWLHGHRIIPFLKPFPC